MSCNAVSLPASRTHDKRPLALVLCGHRTYFRRERAAATFVCIFFLGVPFPVIIIAARLLGWLGTRARSPLFQIGSGHGEAAANALP